jgi:hypothetical protein
MFCVLSFECFVGFLSFVSSGLINKDFRHLRIPQTVRGPYGPLTTAKKTKKNLKTGENNGKNTNYN